MDDKLSLLFWHYAKDFYREVLMYARFIEVNRFQKTQYHLFFSMIYSFNFI